MEKENENLLKLKIDIQVKDDVSFMELATLFDKEDFLNLLPLLRKEYGIDKTMSIDAYYSLVDTFTDEEKYKINFSKYKNPKQLIEHVRENSLGKLDPTRLVDRYQLVDVESNILCYIFHRPPNFAEAIKHAIFCGVVNDSSLHTTAVSIVENDRLLTTVSDFGLPQVAITVTPSTTDKELEAAMSVARTLYQTDPRLSYYKPRTDLINKIRVYRQWFWMHIDGKKYTEIADLWAEKDDAEFAYLDDNRVGKSIRFYKKLLTQ